MAGSALGADPTIERAKALLTLEFVRQALKLADQVKIPRHVVRISERELNRAFAEAEIDMRALQARRSPSRGMSIGKYAGMLAFRLARFRIIHIGSDDAETSWLFLFQELVALIVIFEHCLKQRPPIKHLFELAYQLSRRHANQETLALCFDAFAMSRGGVPKAE